MSTLREEISRARREIISLGGEWDITWTLPRLHKEVDDLKMSCVSGRFVRTAPFSKPSIRHSILYLSIDRVTMFDRDLMPGLCKVRITTVCPTSSRLAVSDESKFAFKPGLLVHRENGGFKILIPLIAGSPCPKNQLKEWRIEFEVLHKFPAAPIYGVVARGWTDPWTLSLAKSLDLPSPEMPPPYIDLAGREINPFHLKPVAKIDFVQDKMVAVSNVHIWRAVVQAIIFAHRLIRATRQTKKNSLERLERDIRLLNARNAGEKETLQMDLMMRTIGVLNEFLVQGAAGKILGPTSGGQQSWLAGWLPQQPSSPVPPLMSQQQGVPDLTHIEHRLDELKSAVEKLQGQSSTYYRPPIVEERREDHHTPRSVADVVETRRRQETVVPRGTVLTRGLIPHAPDVSAPASRTESMITTPEEPAEPVQPAEPLIDTGGVTSALTSAMNAWWGSSEPVVPKKVAEVKKPVVKDPAPSPAEENVEDDEEEEEEEETTAVVARSTVPVAVGGGKVKQQAPLGRPKSPGKTVMGKKMVPKKVVGKKLAPPPQDPAKAKAELILKLKVSEAKRKAEIAKREAELVSFSKKLPPIDRYKFPGMPGPPPFKPKKVEEAKTDPSSLLPSALKGSEEDMDQDEEGAE